MRTNSRLLFLLAPLLTASAGCQEYFTVDEACHPNGNFRGKNVMGPAEAAATDRVNCYRRLTSLSRVGTNQQIYDAATGVTGYVQQNPDLLKDLDIGAFTRQQFARPGYSGTDVFERFDNAEYNPITTTGIHYYEYFILQSSIETDLAGQIDELMTYHGTQEHLLVPSSIDYAIAEITLDDQWWADAAAAGDWENRFGLAADDVPEEGRFIYMVMVSEREPFEHSNEPIYYPKRDQTDAATHAYINPVYRYDSVNDEFEPYTFGAPIYIAYVSPSAGVTATTTGASTGTSDNPFGQEVLHASVHGPSGPIDTVIVNPGSAEVPEEWPQLGSTQGNFGTGIYTTEALEPNTPYTVYYNMTTTDGPYNDSWSFTTGPGNAPGTTTPTAARLDRASERELHPLLRTQLQHRVSVGPR